MQVSGEFREFPAHYLSFRWRNSVQIWSEIFKLVEKGKTVVGTTMSYYSDERNAALVIDGKSTLLILISVAFPVITGVIVGVVACLTLIKKVQQIRSDFFLSSIEGSRLNSIDLFRELSLNAGALATHVSQIAAAAPPSANLQNRHTINLLRFFSLFEIGSKNALDIDDQQQWYVKTKTIELSFIDSIRSLFRRCWSTCSEYLPDQNYTLLMSADRNSYVSLFFKKVNHQFERQLVLPDYVLKGFREHFVRNSHSGSIIDGREIPHLDLLEQLQVVEVKDLQLKVIKVKVLPPPPAQKEDQRIDHVSVFLSESQYKNLSESQYKEFAWFLSAVLHIGANVSFRLDSLTPFPAGGNRRFVISRVKHIDSGTYVELTCLHDNVDFKIFEEVIYLEMCVGNPYKIDDATIDWFRRNDLLDSAKIRKLIGHVIDDNPSHFLGANVELNQVETTPNIYFESRLVFERSFLLKFNPYAHRALLVVAAIFFDSAEAYRAIVSGTGVEFFMDLLIVNSSVNAKKW
jgi:hypothetical protein